MEGEHGKILQTVLSAARVGYTPPSSRKHGDPGVTPVYHENRAAPVRTYIGWVRQLAVPGARPTHWRVQFTPVITQVVDVV